MRLGTLSFMVVLHCGACRFIMKPSFSEQMDFVLARKDIRALETRNRPTAGRNL